MCFLFSLIASKNRKKLPQMCDSDRRNDKCTPKKIKRQALLFQVNRRKIPRPWCHGNNERKVNLKLFTGPVACSVKPNKKVRSAGSNACVSSPEVKTSTSKHQKDQDAGAKRRNCGKLKLNSTFHKPQVGAEKQNRQAEKCAKA